MTDDPMAIILLVILSLSVTGLYLLELAKKARDDD